MDNYNIIDFARYCYKCKNKDVDGSADPCNECLSEPVMHNSNIPLKYENDPKVKDKHV